MYATSSGYLPRGLGSTTTVEGGVEAGLSTAAIATAGIPIVGEIVGIAAALFGPIAGLFQTSVVGKEKIAATNCDNQIATLMQQNLDQWNASSKTVEDQQTAIANYNQLWSELVSCCGNVPGTPGINCVTDRERGGKWPWPVYYLDPIQNATPSDEYSPTGIAEELGVPSTAASLVGWGTVAVLGLMLL